jgi:hypothetical protein
VCSISLSRSELLAVESADLTVHLAALVSLGIEFLESGATKTSVK